jgi:low affinity Fe/Cu permease
MIEKILIFDIILVVLLLVLVLILVKNRKSRRYSSDVKELERKLNEVVKENQESNEEEYVGSPQNKKYHKKDCRFVELLKEKELGTLEEFKKKKYAPCGTCLKK